MKFIFILNKKYLKYFYFKNKNFDKKNFIFFKFNFMKNKIKILNLKKYLFN